MTAWERSIERINWRGAITDIQTPRLLLSLEGFLEGNDDFGSMGYQLNSPVGPRFF